MTNFKVQVRVTKNNGTYLVTTGTYATSNLTVDSNIDLASAYRIVNSPDPVSASDLVTLSYGNANYVTLSTSSLTNYYTKS